ncbi:MAG: cysteine desulfurase, partial [Halobacteriota archaeon]|nr:cysteine desulfurase [Halobacteriota archaeon]
SNLLPWMRLKKYGVGLKFIKPDSKGQLDLVALEEMIDEETRLVAITHASNVLGSITPVNEISKICREYGSLLLVDGAQSVPHLPIDVKDMGCDFMAFSGHKMLGPTGTGILYIKESMMQEIEPLLFGGGMISEVSLEDFSLVESYERFEGGTPNIAGGIGLGKAIEYLDSLGMENVRDHEEMLTKRLLAGLFAIENVEVYGPSDTSERVGTVSFNIKGLNSHDVALILDESSEIMLRSGHHCCIPLIRELGVDGTVRASLYIYNTTEEVDKLLETLEDISRSLG